MEPIPWGDVAVILALVALNGFFAMSELAIVSARKPRLQAMEKAGKRGARTALALAASPGRFLSSVQIGITLVGILAGAYSGATLGGPVGAHFVQLGFSQETAEALGFALVIALTTYVSLVIGELVPKQFALRSPEVIAASVAPIMLWVARIAAPLVWLLDRSTGLAFRLLRLNRESENQVTAEELHLVVAEAQNAGVIEESERQMISGVMRLAGRSVRGVMTPRADVDWIDVDSDDAQVRAQLLESPHARMVVAENSIDHVLGVVEARDLLTALLQNRPLDLRALLLKAPVVPDLMDAMDALAVLRSADVPMLFVHDEYGHFEGILTPADLLSAIAGDFVSDIDAGEEAPMVAREDGSWLISGSYPADQMAETLGIHLPAQRDYETVAGFCLAQLRHLPEVGERFQTPHWLFEVVDMDGRKIDKLLAMPRQTAVPPSQD